MGLRYHNRLTASKTPRVIMVAPMPPEKTAFALARYSRSPDSIRDSVEWVRTHDSAKFLESFYFQYGHASIADLGHVVLCFEGVSELAATEIEDEQLWDGQARSSRYQDFSRSGWITPPEIGVDDEPLYAAAAQRLLSAYHQIHARMCAFLNDRLPRPEDMKPEAYQRNIAARAFDVARYTLFLGIPTGVGQATSIRTLERQVRRMRASEFAEVRDLADEVAEACAAPPQCVLDADALVEPVAPTLARHLDADAHATQARENLAQWARQNLSAASGQVPDAVDLLRLDDTHAEIAATLLYPVTDRPFRELYEMARGWSAPRRNEVIDVALGSRTHRDELLRGFRGGPYAYDIVMDIGAYRDLHRHRRCQQYRQTYTNALGYETPDAIARAGLTDIYDAVMRETMTDFSRLAQPGAQYLLPFAARSRFLFKMDFAEAEYIARLRSGVKGHFSYRKIAWEMKCKMEALEPELGRLMEATPPWVEDPLKR
ncbi:MAG TPA: FAD-dependent thymidylate synthase [Bryobacteraceae bacterium]|nr:FAD-dependent thymidylate synthase [Bryobacteraceae bacterium]